MVSNDDAKVIVSTSIKLDEQEIKIEKLQIGSGKEKIRFSVCKGDRILSRPLILSELELLELLHQAIHNGVLPRNFIGKLRERIEI